MCLLGLAFRQFPDFPVMALANREEFYARPTAPPQLFPRDGDTPAWMGGLDLTAGGTWLGVNELGLFVAVTNRAKTRVPSNPPSRGILCRRLLAQHGTAGAMERALADLGRGAYAGCNLLIADRETAHVIEAGDELKSTPLPPGLHLITNGPFDDPQDLRIARVRRELRQPGSATADDWLREALRTCRLPDDGTGSPVCLIGPDRGTVSATVLGLGTDFLSSQYWYAPGSPASTAFEDFTPLFRQLLAGWAGLGDTPGSAAQTGKVLPDIEPPENSPARRAARQSASVTGPGLHVPDPPADAPYQILLRGPWQAQPLARAVLRPDGSVSWSETDLPEPSTVRLPAAWQDLFDSFRGRIRFLRKFHPPSNLEATDRLSIVFGAVGGHGQVSLNGELLGQIAPVNQSSRFDVTGRLNLNNELAIDLEFTDAANPPGGLYTAVALEICRSGFPA